MGSRGRNYIHGDVEYRGRVITTGMREKHVTVYDETEAEHADRLKAWRDANPDKPKYSAPHDVYFRRSHREDLGLQPYTDDRTYGPYATIGPARAAAGTGRGVSQRIEEGTDHNGQPFRRDHRVEVGTVTWSLLDADGEPVTE